MFGNAKKWIYLKIFLKPKQKFKIWTFKITWKFENLKFLKISKISKFQKKQKISQIWNTNKSREKDPAAWGNSTLSKNSIYFILSYPRKLFFC